MTWELHTEPQQEANDNYIEAKRITRARCVCYNLQTVKEQHQGEVERQSIFRERHHPSFTILNFGCWHFGCSCPNLEWSKRTAPRTGWKRTNLEVKKTSLINVGRWNVSTCTESNDAYISQSIKPLLVQHTIASTQPDRKLTLSIDNKAILENSATRRSTFRKFG